MLALGVSLSRIVVMISQLDVSNIRSEFTVASVKVSDINEHIPTLSFYASQCESICEFGVRSGVSTWGMLNGLVCKSNTGHTGSLTLKGYDLSSMPGVYHQAMQGINGVLNFTADFEQADVLKAEPVVCDLLFIDTFHVYGQLKRELARHAAGVTKYLIMHDTTVDEHYGETIRSGWNADAISIKTGIPKHELLIGLGPAISEFLSNDPTWVLKERFTNNNGLTILEKVNMLAK